MKIGKKHDRNGRGIRNRGGNDRGMHDKKVPVGNYRKKAVYGEETLNLRGLRKLRSCMKFYERPGDALSNRLDFFSLMGDKACARLVGPYFNKLYDPDSYDVIVAIAETGLSLAMLLQAKTGKPVVPVRPVGKIPGHVVQITYGTRRYVMERVEMSIGTLQPGMRVLIVDDYLCTGCTIRAALELVQNYFYCAVTGIAVFSVLEYMCREHNALQGCDVPVRAVLRYDEKPHSEPLNTENTSARVVFYEKWRRGE